MEKSHIVLKRAFEQAGMKKIAADLHLSKALIYKWCQDVPDKDEVGGTSGSRNPLDRIQQIYKTTLDIHLINWICQIANGHFVPNPELDLSSIDKHIFQTTQELIREFSEALQIISESYNDGQRIDLKEARKIRKEWEDVKRVGESFVVACESGMFDKTDQDK